MAKATWRHETFVPVDADRAYAWMIDFREDDHARPAFKRGAGVKPGDKSTSKRVILSREGDVVKLKDTWAGNTFELTVTLDRPARALTIDGKWGYRARWSVEPAVGGARLRVEGEMAPGGLMGLLVPLFAGGMRKDMEKDFRGHVADMIHELNPTSEPLAS